MVKDACHVGDGGEELVASILIDTSEEEGDHLGSFRDVDETEPFTAPVYMVEDIARSLNQQRRNVHVHIQEGQWRFGSDTEANVTVGEVSKLSSTDDGFFVLWESKRQNAPALRALETTQ